MKADARQMPQKGDQGAVWLAWYIALREWLSKGTANQIFLKAWKTRGGESSSTIELRSYLSKNGVNIDKSILDSIEDTGQGFINGIGSFFSIGKNAVYGALGITGIIIVVTAITVLRNPKQAISVAKMAAV